MIDTACTTHAIAPHQEAAVERILAMRKTETSYCLQSFLDQQSNPNQKLVPLSDSWRAKVTQWAFNVVDHFGFSRETVSVSMAIFDRYLATRGNLCTGNMVLLTSLTTLHLAIKLHETKRIKSNVLADLSRGQFAVQNIDEMEMDILSSLSWKVHMPTPLAFVAEFLHFLPAEVSASERKEVYELSKYLTELAVCESSFVDRLNSVVALAAISNVMESIHFERLSLQSKDKFVQLIAKIVMGQVYESSTLKATRERLQTMYAKVSATECFDAAQYGAHLTGGYYGQTMVGGRIVVSPNGSPSSAASGCYGHHHHHYSTKASQPSKATKFWYTPSPPTTRSVGAKTALIG